MKTRNHAFDLLCGICIVRMMQLHINGYCGFETSEWWAPVMDWTYFFMSFFFFKAGYFNKTKSRPGNAGEGGSLRYIIDRAKRLLVPYFVWGGIGCLIYFFFALLILPKENPMVKCLEWSHIWRTGDFYGNTPCWFLLSFFMAYIGMHFMSKVRGLRWVALAFPAISWALAQCDNPLWLSLNNVFMGIFLFFLGRVWHWVLKRLAPPSPTPLTERPNWLRRNLSILLSLFLIAAFVTLNILSPGTYTLHTNTWTGNPFVTIVSIVCALCGLSGLLLSLPMRRIPLLGYIGEHSMVFFVAHYPMLTLYKLIRSAASHSINQHWDDFTILILILFPVCLLLVPHVEKVSWLSGRFKTRPHTAEETSTPSETVSHSEDKE